MGYYPVFLNLRGRFCVVVGGGKVAERKVRALLRAGATVRVVSPELTPRLAVLAARKTITATRRGYRKGDLCSRRSPLLVFAATDDPATQQAVRAEAERVGALVNLADDSAHSTFLVPACFARGELQVAISTSGASPALARKLRRQLQAMLGREYGAHLRFLREARHRVLKSVSQQKARARVFRKLAAKLGAVKIQESKGKSAVARTGSEEPGVRRLKGLRGESA